MSRSHAPGDTARRAVHYLLRRSHRRNGLIFALLIHLFMRALRTLLSPISRYGNSFQWFVPALESELIPRRELDNNHPQNHRETTGFSCLFSFSFFYIATPLPTRQDGTSSRVITVAIPRPFIRRADPRRQSPECRLSFKSPRNLSFGSLKARRGLFRVDSCPARGLRRAPRRPRRGGC